MNALTTINADHLLLATDRDIQSVRQLRATDLLSMPHRRGIVIDLRSDKERDRQGSLPGAVAISPQLVEDRLHPSSHVRLSFARDFAQEYVLISTDGGIAQLSALALTRMGFTRVAIISGGYHAIAASRMTLALQENLLRRDESAFVAHTAA